MSKTLLIALDPGLGSDVNVTGVTATGYCLSALGQGSDTAQKT